MQFKDLQIDQLFWATICECHGMFQKISETYGMAKLPDDIGVFRFQFNPEHEVTAVLSKQSPSSAE